MSAHVQAQVARVLRLVAFALLAQPAVSALVASSVARYPLVAVLVAVAEAGVRQVYPVKPLPRVSSVLPQPAEPPAASSP